MIQLVWQDKHLFLALTIAHFHDSQRRSFHLLTVVDSAQLHGRHERRAEAAQLRGGLRPLSITVALNDAHGGLLVYASEKSGILWSWDASLGLKKS